MAFICGRITGDADWAAGCCRAPAGDCATTDFELASSGSSATIVAGAGSASGWDGGRTGAERIGRHAVAVEILRYRRLL